VSDDNVLFFLTAKARKKDMKKILCNVDSEKSTLLHLAVESGNSEVNNRFKTILNDFLTTHNLL